jgi:general stress protein YciG
MSGNPSGGLKAKVKLLARDPDHYTTIGKAGGQRRVKKGFGTNPVLARAAGHKGGIVSKRRKKVVMTVKPEKNHIYDFGMYILGLGIVLGCLGVIGMAYTAPMGSGHISFQVMVYTTAWGFGLFVTGIAIAVIGLMLKRP